MPSCPHCNVELDGSARGRCPHCGGALAPAAGSDPHPEQAAESTQQAGGQTLVVKVPPKNALPEDPTLTACIDALDALAAELGGEEEQRNMRTLWEEAIHPSSRPGMSLKPSEITVSPESTLSIRSCALHPSPDVPADGTDYELLERVGEGGMGVVYAARQASMDRVVAVKMLHGEIAQDASQRDKFLSEAVVTAELDHPNIVPIHDLGTNESGALFYSMKHIQGIPWSEVIRERSLAENLDILLKVCDAIAFAHTRGIIHRDLKPENVMLGDFGEVLVMDWGLAQTTAAFRRNQFVSQHAGLGGTPAYMAPEMAKGLTDQIGTCSDVYLLGATLFEVITGKPPHAGKDTMACLYAAAANRLEPHEEEGELLEIALRAMATSIEARTPSVQALQAAIRDYQSHAESIRLVDHASLELSKAQETLAYERFAEALYGYKEALTLWPENDRARAGLSVAQLAYAEHAATREDYDLADSLLDADNPQHQPLAAEIDAHRVDRDSRLRRLKTSKRVAKLLVALTFATVTVSYFWIRADRNHARSMEAEALKNLHASKLHQAQSEREAERANQAAQRATEERLAKEYETYVAQIGLAAAKVDENAFREARLLLEKSGRSPHKHWEWGRLQFLCGKHAARFATNDRVEAVALGPQGRRAAANRAGEVLLWQKGAGEPPQVLPHPGLYVHAVRFDPTGSRLATGASDGAVRVFDAASGALLFAAQAHEDSVLCLDFAREGKTLVTGSYDTTLRVWDVGARSLEPRQTLRNHTWWVWSVQFSPDGRRILSTGHDGLATIWQQDVQGTFSKRTDFDGHQGPVYCGAFFADGRHVVTGGHDKRLLIWDVEVWKPADVRERLARASTRSALVRSLEGHAAPVRAVDTSRDGLRLVSGSLDNTLRVWDFESGESLKTLRGHERAVYDCRFSPDGRFVLSGSHDHSVRLWEVGSYSEVRFLATRALEGHSDGILGGTFSPQGDFVVTAGRDRSARIWSTGQAELLSELREGHDYLVSSVAFFPDGQRMVTGGGDDTARIWDLQSGTELARFDGMGRNGVLALSPDGSLLASATARDVLLVRTQDGITEHRCSEHVANVTAVAFAPDGNSLYVGTATGHAALWSSGGKRLWQNRVHSGAVTAAAFLPRGDGIVTASADRTVTVVETRSGRECAGQILKHPRGVTSMALAQDGRHVLTAAGDARLRRWDLDTQQVTTSWVVPPLATTFASNVRRLARDRGWTWDRLAGAAQLPGGRLDTLLQGSAEPTEEEVQRLATSLRVAPETLVQPHVQAVAQSPNGRYALAILAAERALRLFDLERDAEVHPQGGADQPFLELPAPELLWAAAFTPGSQQLVTLGGNDVRLFDLQTGTEHMRFRPHGAVSAVACSPRGDLVATGSWDNTARLWNRETGRALCKLRGHDGNVNAVAFTPSGKRVLTASDDGTARLWTLDGEVDQVFRGHLGPVLDARPDRSGNHIVTGSADGMVRVWRMDGTCARVLHEPQGDGVRASAIVCVAAFEVGGTRVIAAGGEDGVVKLWDAGSGELQVALEGHRAGITSLGVSPDGARLVTGSRDATAKLWDTTTGKEVLTLKGHQHEVTAVAFSPDGQLVLTASRDGLAMLWPALSYRDAVTAVAGGD